MHFSALHSVRGIAAFAVLLHHLFLTFPAAFSNIRVRDPDAWLHYETWMRYTPLHAIFSGRPSVVLFFVLSGFVLVIFYEKTKYNGYISYFIKRFCRIYLPFVASILFSVLLYAAAQPTPVSALSVWFNERSWTTQPDPELVLRHLLMLGSGASMSLNNVMWSLVHELRISIFFPILLVALDRAGDWKRGLAFFFAVWCLAFIAGHFVGDTVLGSLIDTLRYTFFFAIGVLVYRSRDAVQEFAAAIGSGWNAVFCFLAIVLFSIRPGIPGAELGYGLAAVYFVSAAIGRPGVISFLDVPVFRWLGRVSYSLYLVHLPILLYFFHTFSGKVGSGPIVLLVIVASLFVAEIAFRFVERPSIDIGRYLARLRTTQPSALP